MKKLCTAGLLTGVLLLGSVGGAFADSRVDDVSKGLDAKVSKIASENMKPINGTKMNKEIIKDGTIEITKLDNGTLEIKQLKDGKLEITKLEDGAVSLKKLDDGKLEITKLNQSKVAIKK